MKQFLLLSLLFFSITVLAETREVKGLVLDKGNEPLIGATVQLSGTLKGTVVGFDGSFKLGGLEPGKHTINISFMGYKEQVHVINIPFDEDIVIILDEDDQMVGEVVVTGTMAKKTATSARATERMASKVVNVVSAQTIELSPDLDVANVVKRISGVSLERNNSGDGQYAIVRGMDKRYNYTLVNGVKIPSPDNKNRYVPLDIFPSDLMDRLEVTKALTPDMEGDAVGGAINLVMKDAPDKFEGQFNMSVGGNTLFNADNPFMSWDQSGMMQSPPTWSGANRATDGDFSVSHMKNQYQNYVPNIIAGGSIGDRFFDDKLGVIVAASYQQTARGSESTWYQTGMQTNNSTRLDNMEERNYSQLQKRAGVHNKIDLRINPNHKLNWYNAFVYLRNDQVRDVTRTRTWGSYDPINGNAGEMSFNTRYRSTIQQIFNSTLSGEHRVADKVVIDWSGVYSKATNDIPDNLRFSRSGEMNNWVVSPERIAEINALRRRWDKNDDQDIAMYANITMNPDVSFATKSEFKFGGLVRYKDRTNDYESFTFSAGNRALVQGVDWNDITDVDWKMNGNGSGVTASPNTYNSHENIKAAYGQFLFDINDRLEIVGGVRMEHTDIGYFLPNPTMENEDNNEVEMNETYMDFLPSIHFKYKLDKNQNIRASYFKSVIRPGFAEFVPISNTDTEDDWEERGNPNVQRTIGHNLDLRYEFFPSGLDKFMIGGFYKQLIDPIEYALNRTAGYIMPDNFGTATNWGIELDVVKYFRNFGISGNYTYTNSEITTDKSYYTRVDPDDSSSDLILATREETRSLQGQAAHIGNLSLLYKDSKRGLDIQLASVYTGDRIHSLSAFYKNDMWQRGFWQLDFSAEKKIGNVTVYTKLYNLLNNAYEIEIRQPITSDQAMFPQQGETGDNVLVRQDFYGRQFLIGLKYKF
ncbi:TonB-dependent receptor [Saccharicrinis aurantiacus]|uniref:TonB-dependent receptor n=1 Tax=Saccharicrinis aurantiacus TaxID=1849719 RepID=UPI0009500825|nr:TonB-dependent receptor [Saccharicrinis aurantiacus]